MSEYVRRQGARAGIILVSNVVVRLAAASLRTWSSFPLYGERLILAFHPLSHKASEVPLN